MSMRRVLMLAVVAAGSTGLHAFTPTSVLAAAPEPDPVPRRWQLDFEPGPLRITSVEVPGAGPRAYFYFTYRVTNNTGREQLLAPLFDLASSEGDLRRAGRDVPLFVMQKIQGMLDNPLLEDQVEILGPIQRGPENARDGLVVWPVDDLKIDELVIYAGGFSGESATVEVPVPAEEVDAARARTEQGEDMDLVARGSDFRQLEDGSWVKRVVLRKTMMIRYDVPGDLNIGRVAPLEEGERRWIMR
ncbi:MAG: hypothetical protein RBS39_03985 [Phycisphaerales bacterium]|jgi:hypothetical protein|nr:hypothetical protein [Phycisphaerales bacterium]